MFIALMNVLLVLGQKGDRTKEEVLAYDHFLGYAGSVARYNRLVVEEEIDRKLEPERWPDAPRRPNPAARVA
jgi:hypothetical protein